MDFGEGAGILDFGCGGRRILDFGLGKGENESADFADFRRFYEGKKYLSSPASVTLCSMRSLWLNSLPCSASRKTSALKLTGGGLQSRIEPVWPPVHWPIHGVWYCEGLFDGKISC